VRVTERPPAAWLPRAGCAVAADGLLLAHVTRREPGWVALEGLGVAQGRVAERAVFAEALELSKLIAALGGTEAGSVRRVSGEGWEWTASGRRIRISSPLVPDELRRLRRFRESFPAEWKNATRLDLRFLGRVVVKS
jgi:hypothetical protein